MAVVLDTNEFLDMICQLLEQGHTAVPVPVAGNSMVPFLHHGDTVYLDVPQRPLKRGDIVLYTRNSGRYILHRIYKVCRDGSYIMVGDAQQELERIPRREQIHAIVTSAQHKGKPLHPKSLRWWVYKHIWLRLVPLRYRLMDLRGKFGRRAK